MIDYSQLTKLANFDTCQIYTGLPAKQKEQAISIQCFLLSVA